MKYEKRYKKYKQLLCLFLSFVLLWGILPIEAVFAVEEETVQETEARQGGEQETDDGASETGETETETVAYTTYTNSISGMLWVDMYENTANRIYSGDGIRQESELPLTGYTVSLYREDDRDNAVAITVTDEDGMYEFVGLEPGVYVAGIATGTIDGTEYLLPLTFTSDNKFAGTYDVASDAYIYAYTAPIEIAEDSDVTGIDAGMRTTPRIRTRDVSPFLVISDNNPTGEEKNSLSDVAGYINGGSESKYTISLRSNYTAYSWENLYIDKPVEITITSESANNTYTIFTPTSSEQWAFIHINNGYTGCILTLQNIIIDGSGSNNSVDVGICSGDKGSIILKDGAIIQNFETSQGTILATNTDVYINTGSAILYNTVKGNGGGIAVTNSTIYMSGGTISNNTAGYGGGVQLNDSELFMSGGSISGNTAINAGGGVNAQSPRGIRSKITLSGTAMISNNTAENESGGGMQIDNSELEMRGGTISNNEAKNGGGGGVNVMYSSTFTMMGGTIAGNQAMDGGGVNLLSTDSWDNKSSTFTMKGGLIGSKSNSGGNTATASGGGVFVGSASAFSIEDSLSEIVGNQATDAGGGVYVYYADGGGTRFSMTAGLISNNVVTGIEKPVGDGKVFHGHGGGIAFYVANGFYAVGDDGTDGGLNSLDVTLTGGEISNNKAIIGGGIGFFNDSEWGRNVGFTIGDKIKIERNEAKTYSTTDIGGNGGGVGTATPYGGYLSLTMNGGEITNNTTNGSANYQGGNGSGIYCDPGTSFTMEAGTISDNTASGSGGGVYFHQGKYDGIGTFTMTDGTISNNNAWEGGGIFHSAYNASTITNGTIDGNKAINAGGGICFTGGDGKLSIGVNTTTGVTISNNRAENETYATLAYGGGIYVIDPASLEIRNTTFINNYAMMGGGGIFTTTKSGQNVPAYYKNLDIDESVKFIGNKALYKYEPPTSATIAKFFSTITNARDTTSTEYGHALNHYDINRVLYEVRVIHLGPDYQPFYANLNTSTMIPNGNEFSTHTPATIEKYVYEKWAVKTATTDSDWRNTPVYLPYVFEDSVISLYYEGLGSITIKKNTPDGGGLNDVTFMLEQWDADTNTWKEYETQTTKAIKDEDGKLVFSNLEPGKYRVTETKVPEGYSLLAETFEATIPYTKTYDSLNQAEKGYLYYSEGKNTDGEMNYTCYYYDLTYTVTNQSAFTLPAAGSTGFLSRYYLWIGLTILLGAGGSHAYRQRRRRSCG